MTELYCITGKPHEWVLSGALFKEWTSNNTSGEDAPKHPNRAEQVCCNCSAKRIVEIGEKR